MIAGKAWIAAIAAAAVMSSGCARSPEERAKRFLAAGQQQFEKGDYTRALLQFFNAMEATPKAPEPYYRVALTYIAGGDTHNGVVYLQKALRKDPAHTASQVKLCEYMLMSLNETQTAEARQRLLGVVAREPANLDALTALALAEWQTRNPAAAEKRLRDAMDRFPQEMKPLVALARMKLGQGDLPGAEAVLREAASKPSPRAEAVVAYAELLLMTGRSEDAARQLERASAIDPKNAPALLDLASVHHRAGRTAEAEKLYRRVSDLGGENRAVHPNYLFMTGRKEEALRLYERLHRDSPDDRAARSRLVAAYMAVDRLLDAEKVVGAAIEKNRKDAEALLQRATLRVIAGDVAGAQMDANEVLRFRPESGEAHYVLAQIHARQGSTLLRKQELGEALKLNASLLPARLELARLMTGTHAAEGAMMLIDDTPEHQKNSVEVLTERNRALMALGRAEEAAKGIESGLKISREPALLKQRAALALAARDYEGARARLDEALAANPEDAEAVELLARTYVAQGQPKTAVEKLRQMAAARPGSAGLQYAAGQIAMVAGDPAGAKASFEAARSADPKFAPASIAIAQLEAASGGAARARSLLESVLASDARNGGARLLLAQVERSSGNSAAAIAHARKVLENEPRNLAALNNAAYWLAESGRTDEALQFAEKAKEIAPSNPAVADTLGWIVYRKGLYSNAVRHLEDAVAQEPTARRKFHLAMAYYRAGDGKRSRELLQSALKLEPSSPEAKAAVDLIR